MSLDEDLYNQPTEPQTRIKPVPTAPSVGAALRAQFIAPSGQVPPPTPVPTSSAAHAHRITRRTLLGASVVGLAAGASGIALEQWMQHGGLSNLLHGPIANSMQIGHLLRRAGFGASPDDLATYKNLSYSDAV